MISLGKLNITKGFDEWIALHEVMAPKMLAVGTQFRFAVANPIEDTLFLLIEMNGDIEEMLDAVNNPKAIEMREAAGVKVETQEMISSIDYSVFWEKDVHNTSVKILGTLDIGDEFKIEETTKYLRLSGSDKLIWSGYSSEENKLYFLMETTSEAKKDYELISEIKAVYFP